MSRSTSTSTSTSMSMSTFHDEHLQCGSSLHINVQATDAERRPTGLELSCCGTSTPRSAWNHFVTPDQSRCASFSMRSIGVTIRSMDGVRSSMKSVIL